jgi:HlyD family secretion protein
MKIKRSQIILWIPVAILLVAVIVLIVNAAKPEQKYLTGIVETTEVDVASKIPGRIDTVFVDEGNMVRKGQVLAKLESKELDAKLEQARGVMEAAKSKMDMAHNGARPEEKEAAEKLYLQSQHQYELAEKTWNRIQSLYKDNVVSTQEKDQVEFQYKAAQEQMEAAKAKYEMVMKGARWEEISGAEALYYQAQNTYNEALAYHQELELKSPINGELSKKISDQGEIIASGYPLFTVNDLNDIWVTLQVREDQMKFVKKGSEFIGKVPALGNEEYEFVVSYISPMADFASWRATNQKGDFDLKTFEVRLRSKHNIDGLRTGMSVNIAL